MHPRYKGGRVGGAANASTPYHFTVDGVDLTQGIYMVKIQTKGMTIIRKLIVQK